METTQRNSPCFLKLAKLHVSHFLLFFFSYKIREQDGRADFVVVGVLGGLAWV
jgi:hypothetical protein